MQISGAIAVVTGGANGLGLAISERLAACGATVTVLDRDVAASARLPEGISGAVTDVTDPNQARESIARIAAAYGRVDILVNNAGVIHSGPMVNLGDADDWMHSYEKFRDCMVANADSAFIMTSAAVEQMILRRTRGVIVNISSISARGNEGQVAYSAAKAAVNGMTIALSKELGRWGIRCNAIAPGFIDTASTQRALSSAHLSHIREHTPLRRLGDANEVAQAVQSVIENDFITGVVLGVDGGLSI